MIKDTERYFSLSGDVILGKSSTWYVTDWDQRRVISVTMDGEQDDESLAIQFLRRHIDSIPSNVYGVYISDAGEIVSTYTDAKHDHTYFVHYPFLSEVNLPEEIQTVSRDALEELDRLGPDADLVQYHSPSCLETTMKKVVFKYYFHIQYAARSWNEMNIWMRLPRHPNIVPFDRVVTDELEGRVVGFTNNYIPGGSLEENKSRVFKLKWLQQLTDLADDLNLRFGISHQDIAPRNLVIDDSTDCIMLFDFNFAARINCSSRVEDEAYIEERNDVKGVEFTMYEIITRDDSLRRVPHEDQHEENLPQYWVKHADVKLDHPVADYQLLLQDWKARRFSTDKHDGLGNKPPELINWTARPKPPKKTWNVLDSNFNPLALVVDKNYERRQDVWARGEKGLNWERPSQRSLGEGVRVLSNGEVKKPCDYN